MTPRRRKILLVAEAVTLAHVGRVLAVAGGLDRERFDVIVACDPRYREITGQAGVTVHEIRSISGQQFFAALRNGAPIYRSRDLIDYVAEDRAVIGRYQPDVVIGDFRLSLLASARLERVPYVNLTNAYWSPHARVDFLVPDLPVTRIFGAFVAQQLFNVVRSFAFAQHAAPINRMLRHFSLPPGRKDVRYAYTAADYTLYSDIAELVPMRALPARHQFIGPIQWAPEVARPPWWASIPRDRPIVYANLGSSGSVEVLPLILQALKTLPVTTIAATAGRVGLEQFGEHSFVAPFLPGDEAAELASVVICNGGSPSCYQALAAGRPIVGIPSNLDQFLNMSLVCRAGAGMLIRAQRSIQRDLANAVAATLQNPSFLARATAIQQRVRSYRPIETIQALLEAPWP